MRVAVCCEVSPAVGACHVTRCLALAEELAARDATVVFVCDAAASPWAQAQIEARGMEVVEPAGSIDDTLALFERLAVDAVVLDSDPVPADLVAAVRRSGRPTLAVVDGDAGGAEPDLLVDVSTDAGQRRQRASRGPQVLAGLEYALMRNDVLANRSVAPPVLDSVKMPWVTAVFDDGSARTAAAVASALVATGRPFHATFVASRPEARDRLADIRPAPRQHIDAVQPDWRLHERVRRSDVVLAPADPSTLEWLCMGSAVGLVWSEDGQVDLYRHLMVRRAVIGLGTVANLEEEQPAAADKAARLLMDARERSRLADAGWRLVDGLGRARVVDALLARV